MIDTPDFVSKHLSLCKGNFENTHLLVFERSSKWGDKGCILRRTDTFRKTHQYDFVTGQDGTYVEVEGHINGVLLMHMADPSETTGKLGNLVVLWNPSIRKSVRIPPPPILSKSTSKLKVEFCFGFDPFREDYKVLVITYHGPLSKVRVLIEVYSLSTGSWRVISNDLSFWCSKEKSFLEGAIYMTGRALQASTPYHTHLVSFDVFCEVFNAIALPNVENSAELLDRTVTLIDQSVGLFDFGGNCSIVWVLDKHGGTESWTKHYTIDKTSDSLFYVERKGLFYVEKIHLLLFEGVGEGLKSYDIQTKQLKLLAKTIAYDSIHFVDAYVESLALLRQTCKNSIPRPSDDEKKNQMDND